MAVYTDNGILDPKGWEASSDLGRSGRHHCIQIYIWLKGDTVLFTDDGYTLNPLYMTGSQLTLARKKALDSILRQYGVTLNGNALETKSSIETFAQRKHLFLQAIMRVDAFLSDVCLMT